MGAATSSELQEALEEDAVDDLSIGLTRRGQYWFALLFNFSKTSAIVSMSASVGDMRATRAERANARPSPSLAGI